MFEIVSKEQLATGIVRLEVSAPDIANKAQPGQFIIVIIGETGERVPLTIAEYDARKGTIGFVFNEVGKTTKKLGCFEKGDKIPSVAGPLGNPSEIRHFGQTLCVGAGVMTAPLYLQVKALKKAGNRITSIVGARIKDLLILEDQIKNNSDEFYVATDDGSKGFKGLGFLKDLLQNKPFDHAVVMAPVITMKTVAEMTKPYGIRTIATLTPIMVDGMGMCGVCRVTVGGETKFACLDGPEFDAHQVDFEELVKRQRMFLPEERFSSLMWEKMRGGCSGKA